MICNLPARRVPGSRMIAGSMPVPWAGGQGPAAATIEDPLSPDFARTAQEVFNASGVQEITRERVPRLDDDG